MNAMSDLTNEELIYLRSVANQRWYSTVPFKLDHISLGLILKGYVVVSPWYNDWEVTEKGRIELSAPR